MLKRIREEQKNEDGFTLIELMVVVLIISILIAIAIPTFLGAREGAEDRSAQSNLRNALTAAKVYYADEGIWLDASNTAADTTAEVRALVATAEPSLTFQDAIVDDTVASNVVQAVFTAQSVSLAGYSASGTCFYLLEVASGTGAGTFFQELPADASNDCAAPPAATDTNWAQGGW